jgi:hypothetical protein
VRHNATVGGAHDYFTTQVQLQAARISSVAYTMPLCAKLPVDASFDAHEPAGTWVSLVTLQMRALWAGAVCAWALEGHVTSRPAPSMIHPLPTIQPPQKAWKASSGHIVVRVSINGISPGYMLLDTGASGFVLQTGLAAKYGLTRFGKLNIAGLTGKVGGGVLGRWGVWGGAYAAGER